MKKKVVAVIKLDDGKHEGKIKDINYKTEPYEYVDVLIEEKETELPIICGVPFNISDNTALGIMLKNFGAKLEVDKEIEIEDYIRAGTEVEFVSVMETTKKGTFCKVQPQSLKPKK